MNATQPDERAGNYVHDMQDAGIALMESMDADIHDNTFEGVRFGVRLSLGCARNKVYRNTFATCSDCESPSSPSSPLLLMLLLFCRGRCEPLLHVVVHVGRLDGPGVVVDVLEHPARAQQTSARVFCSICKI